MYKLISAECPFRRMTYGLNLKSSTGIFTTLKMQTTKSIVNNPIR